MDFNPNHGRSLWDPRRSSRYQLPGAWNFIMANDSRWIFPEKNLDSALSQTNFISDHHWNTFVSPPNRINATHIVEFYANLSSQVYEEYVFVRGVYVDISVRRLQQLLDLQPTREGHEHAIRRRFTGDSSGLLIAIRHRLLRDPRDFGLQESEIGAENDPVTF